MIDNTIPALYLGYTPQDTLALIVNSWELPLALYYIR